MGTKFDDIVKDYMLSFVDDREYCLNDYKSGSKFIIDILNNSMFESYVLLRIFDQGVILDGVFQSYFAA
jgi:hypothetical protein